MNVDLGARLHPIIGGASTGRVLLSLMTAGRSRIPWAFDRN